MPNKSTKPATATPPATTAEVAPAAAPAVPTPSATPVKKAAAKVASPAKAAAPVRKAAAPGTPTGDKFLDEQRVALLAERITYEEQADHLKAEADALAMDMEPGDVQFDEESGEGGTTNMDRERDLALSAQARAQIEEIDRALNKIAIGTYGTCERCGQPIPKLRLRALPYAAMCITCKSGGLSARR